MTRLPNCDRATLDIRKLEEYCLNPAHPRGRHKARVFRDALGLQRNDASWLRNVLLEAASSNEAHQVAIDAHGTRWRVDLAVTRGAKSVMLRSVWIVRAGETLPRFVTCWVL
jgi:hypothetical protein